MRSARPHHHHAVRTSPTYHGTKFSSCNRPLVLRLEYVRVSLRAGFSMQAIVPCPPELVGRVIGRHGQTINHIQSTTGSQIQVDQNVVNGVCMITVQGAPENVQSATSMLWTLIMHHPQIPPQGYVVLDGHTQRFAPMPNMMVAAGSYAAGGFQPMMSGTMGAMTSAQGWHLPYSSGSAPYPMVGASMPGMLGGSWMGGMPMPQMLLPGQQMGTAADMNDGTQGHMPKVPAEYGAAGYSEWLLPLNQQLPLPPQAIPAALQQPPSAAVYSGTFTSSAAPFEPRAPLPDLPGPSAPGSLATANAEVEGSECSSTLDLPRGPLAQRSRSARRRSQRFRAKAARNGHVVFQAQQAAETTDALPLAATLAPLAEALADSLSEHARTMSDGTMSDGGQEEVGSVPAGTLRGEAPVGLRAKPASTLSPSAEQSASTRSSPISNASLSHPSPRTSMSLCLVLVSCHPRPPASSGNLPGS